MRLSRKGFNNVVIFAVFLVIFIANFSHKLTFSPQIQQTSVINKDLTIVEIKTPDYKISRFGRTWQSEPDLGLSEQQLALLVHNWQNLKLTTQPAVSDTSAPYTIQIYTADQVQPIIVQLFQQEENYLLQTESTMSLLLNSKQLPLLLGR